MTRSRDKRLMPYLALAFVVTLGFFELIGLLLSDTIIFTVFGVISAALVTFIVFGQRAQRAALGDIEGQPGAAAAIITNMRGDWRFTPNVAANRTMDVVHRVVGKPGVILIGEGSTDRLQPLIADQRKRVQRVAAGTPIEVIIVGREAGQVPLQKLQTQDDAAAPHVQGPDGRRDRGPDARARRLRRSRSRRARCPRARGCRRASSRLARALLGGRRRSRPPCRAGRAGRGHRSPRARRAAAGTSGRRPPGAQPARRRAA